MFSRLWIQNGILWNTNMVKVQIRYLLRKSGSLDDNRRIPSDLKPHFPPGRAFIRSNLHTTDPWNAGSPIPALAAKDDALFEQLLLGQVPEADVLLSTARERYLSEHKRGRTSASLGMSIEQSILSSPLLGTFLFRTTHATTHAKSAMVLVKDTLPRPFAGNWTSINA